VHTKDDINVCLDQLQEAEDNYYLTAKYVLELVNRAYDLFISSEVEEKRQLIKLILSNVRLVDENIVYDAQKPFNLILKTADSKLWRPTRDQFLNGNMILGVNLQHIQTVFSTFGMQPFL
jgi:hypothetical protein